MKKLFLVLIVLGLGTAYADDPITSPKEGRKEKSALIPSPISEGKPPKLEPGTRTKSQKQRPQNGKGTSKSGIRP